MSCERFSTFCTKRLLTIGGEHAAVSRSNHHPKHVRHSSEFQAVDLQSASFENVGLVDIKAARSEMGRLSVQTGVKTHLWFRPNKQTVVYLKMAFSVPLHVLPRCSWTLAAHSALPGEQWKPCELQKRKSRKVGKCLLDSHILVNSHRIIRFFYLLTAPKHAAVVPSSTWSQ